MAFKMKGSAFKLGNVATKSALKNTGAEYLQDRRDGGNPPDASDRQYAAKHDETHAANDPKNPAHEETEPTPIEEQPAAPKMKSPMKGEKKMVDGVELHPDGHEGHHRVGKAANQNWGKEKVEKAPTKMKSPMKQSNLYTCPECGAKFELPEYLAEHMEEHLSGDTGTGTPGSDYAGVKRNRGNFGKRIKSLFRRR